MPATSRAKRRPRKIAPPAGFAVILALALLASGCFSTDPDPPDPPLPEDPSSARDRFQDPVLVGPGGDAETSLVIASDGTMLACAHGGFRIPSPLWVSQDTGETWRRLDPQPNVVPSGDCDVAILDDGSWVMVYDTIASATIAVSHDQGASWVFNYASALPIKVDRPWIQAAGNDVYMTYANVMAAEPAINMFARSTDRGHTWIDHRPISVAEPPDKTQNVMGHMVTYNDHQTIRVPISRFPLNQIGTGPWTLELVTSRDGGATWTADEVISGVRTSVWLASLARAGDGTLYTAVPLTGEDGSDIVILASFDDGASWSDPIHVASGVRFPGVRGPWVDARSDGSATLAWLHNARDDEPQGAGWQAWAARVDAHDVDDPVRWVGPVTDPVNDYNLYEFIMVRHDADDRAHVMHLVTGPGCADDPSASRSTQCLWLVSESPS